MHKTTLQELENREDYFKIPNAFFWDPAYMDMSVEAKMLYGLMANRMQLSFRNNRDFGQWVDDEGYVFMYYKNEEIMKQLGIKGKAKVSNIKKELISHDLMSEARQRLGQPNRIYLGSVIWHERPKDEADKASDINYSLKNEPLRFENQTTEVRKSNYGGSKIEPQTFENQISVVSKSNTIKKEVIKKENIKLDSKNFEEESSTATRMSETDIPKDSIEELSRLEPELTGIISDLQDFIQEDPEQAYIVLDSAAKAYWGLFRAHKQGNRALFKQSLTLPSGSDVAQKVMEQLFWSTMKNTRSNVKDANHFGQYFAIGMENALKVYTRAS